MGHVVGIRDAWTAQGGRFCLGYGGPPPKCWGSIVLTDDYKNAEFRYLSISSRHYSFACGGRFGVGCPFPVKRRYRVLGTWRLPGPKTTSEVLIATRRFLDVDSFIAEPDADAGRQ